MKYFLSFYFISKTCLIGCSSRKQDLKTQNKFFSKNLHSPSEDRDFGFAKIIERGRAEHKFLYCPLGQRNLMRVFEKKVCGVFC